MCIWCERSPIAGLLTAGWTPALPQRRASPAGEPATGPGATPRSADVVFRNGTIRTMAGGPDPVEALALSGTRIVAAGSAADLAALTTAATTVVDLDGRTVLPGLIDPHHHYTLSAVLGRLLLDIGYSTYPARQDALSALRSAAMKTPPGQWIAAGFYDNLLQGGELSMAALDAVSAQHPIFVMYVNGHVGAGNSMAFERAGIGPEVGTIAGGGHFGRAADGTLDGLIYEQPALMRFLSVAVPPSTPRLIAEALTDYAKQAAAAGNTTLHEPGTVKPDWVEHLAQLSNALDVRLSASFSTDDVEASRNFAALSPAGTARRVAGSRFSLYGMKFWADGSNQAEMAAQTQPYLHSTEKGSANYRVDEMTRLCRAALDLLRTGLV